MKQYNKAIDDVIVGLNEGIQDLRSKRNNKSIFDSLGFGDVDFEKIELLEEAMVYIRNEVRKMKK